MEVSSEQLKEYESQLSGVEELLIDSPNDATLLSLKSDLEELINLAREENNTETGEAEGTVSETVPTTAGSAAATIASTGPEDSTVTTETEAVVSDQNNNDSIPEATPSTTTTGASTTKKTRKKIKEFEIPPHLLPRENDSETERNRKKRAVKNMKNKWREQKKEVESQKKQKSWQSFQQKKRLKNDKSIFSTHEEIDTKVGVGSGRRMTEFNERKRHKHY